MHGSELGFALLSKLVNELMLELECLDVNDYMLSIVLLLSRGIRNDYKKGKGPLRRQLFVP
jgi:hypothetical protein